MVKVELEIGDNLKESINSITNAVNIENGRCNNCEYGYTSPGDEIRKAFKIDFTKIISKVLKSQKSSTGKDRYYFWI